ncbi:MAG TPA: hypothetical protein PKM16_09825, partial [Bacteroidia bacterium]|nr:hypothetical protein [Bacteroidia bacterium]
MEKTSTKGFITKISSALQRVCSTVAVWLSGNWTTNSSTTCTPVFILKNSEPLPGKSQAVKAFLFHKQTHKNPYTMRPEFYNGTNDNLNGKIHNNMNTFLRLRKLSKTALMAVVFALMSYGAFAQVTVSGSTGADGTYTTLKLAFDAINATGQTGNNISILLTANTTETAAAQLNAGLWTSLSITCNTPVTISGSIADGIIRLAAADNVTIDGRIAGVGRNITVNNTSTSSSCAVRVSSTSTTVGCDNVVVRNCILRCGTDPSASTTATYGVLVSGTSISHTSTLNLAPQNSISVIDNDIQKVRHGIAIRGPVGNLSQNIIIDKNDIGPSGFGSDQIGKSGILVAGVNNCQITENEIGFVGVLFSQTAGGSDRAGIVIGDESWSTAPSTLTTTNVTCSRNLIHDIIEEKTFSSIGIRLGTTGSPTNNIICSNIIYNVRANGTAGDAVVGIGISGGSGDQVLHNSIAITGDVDPTPASTTTSTAACLKVLGTNPVNLSILNNVFYLDVNSNTGTLLHSCIQLPSATFAFGTGALNYNDYYFPPANTQCRTGAIGSATNSPSTFHLSLANWQAALTPAQDANSIALDPGFTSATDLHINLGATALNNVGTPVASCAVDFDNDARSGTTPD